MGLTARDPALRGLTLPRPVTYGMHDEGLRQLKEEQHLWRQKHQMMVDRRRKELRSRESYAPCPPLTPLLDEGVRRRRPNSQPSSQMRNAQGASESYKLSSDLRWVESRNWTRPPVWTTSFSVGTRQRQVQTPLTPAMAHTTTSPPVEPSNMMSPKSHRLLSQLRGVIQSEGSRRDPAGASLGNAGTTASAPQAEGGASSSGAPAFSLQSEEAPKAVKKAYRFDFEEDEGESATQEFDKCMALAKKLRLPLRVVRHYCAAFEQIDADGNGALSPMEFERVVRELCGVAPGSCTPPHLLEQQWNLLNQNKTGFVGPEEFILWSRSVAFNEEITVPSEERAFRELARKHQWPLNEVDDTKAMFDRFNKDQSGSVGESEFCDILCHVMNVKDKSDVPAMTLQRYFREVDVDGSGDVTFEEFLLWYLTVFKSV